VRITLNISETLMRDLKREAAEQGKTMTEFVEAVLRARLQHKLGEAGLPPLREFSSGGAKVDGADRDMLYDVMESSARAL
jgi:hypothetical protein